MRVLLACLFASTVLLFCMKSQIADQSIIRDNARYITQDSQSNLKELFKGLYSPDAEAFSSGSFSITLNNGIWVYSKATRNLSIQKDFNGIDGVNTILLTPIITVDTTVELKANYSNDLINYVTPGSSL